MNEQADQALCLMNQLGYTGYKLISQYTYLPVEYPPSGEQRISEQARQLLSTRKLSVRVLRKCGGRRWLQHRMDRTRTRGGWVFPSGSSGSFGQDTLGAWQTYKQIKETLNTALAEFDARKDSVFWSNKEYSFWADFHVKR